MNKDSTEISLKPEDKDSAKKKGLPRWAKIVLAMVLIDVVGGGLWFYVFSPQARIKKSVNGLMDSVRRKDTPDIMKHFSDTYYDEGGNNKAAIEQMALMAFDYTDKVYIRIDEIKVEAKGKQGAAAVKGFFKATFKGAPIKEDFSKEPLGFYFTKEPDGWKITAIAGMSFSLVDDIKSYESEMENPVF